MVSNGIRWSYFYGITLGIAAITFCFMGWAFRGFEQDGPVQLQSVLERTASRQNPAMPTKMQLLKTSLKNRTTILGATFIL
jgi:hypothetical protein